MIKIIFKVLFTLCLLLAIYLSYELVLRDKWQVHTENRIKKSIVKNYSLSKPYFKDLHEYVSHFSPFSELSFMEYDKIAINMHSDSVRIDSSMMGITSWEVSPYRMDSIVLVDKNELRLYYPDTTIASSNWYWYFEGSQNDFGYQNVLKYLNMNQQQMDTIKSLLTKINCVGIEKGKDFIAFTYEGSIACRYEYVISASNIYAKNNYVQLDSNIFCGSYRSDMFCGNVFWSK